VRERLAGIARRLRRPKTAAPAVALAAGLAGAAALAGGLASGGEDPKKRPKAPPEPVLTPESIGKAAKDLRDEAKRREARGRVVDIRGAGSRPPGGGASARRDGPAPGAPTDAEVRKELKQARAALSDFKQYLSTTAFLETGPRAKVLPDGTAVAPDKAPDIVQRVILAANQIAKFPYKWGGGHGAWKDSGYDCSGSVSFALAGAGLLGRPLASGGFMSYGKPGKGKWITIFANDGHMFMVVAGLRFDTSGRGRAGTRWQESSRGAVGYEVRHPPGL
jgi:cell wall-associated NlpC family hydrolase